MICTRLTLLALTWASGRVLIVTPCILHLIALVLHYFCIISISYNMLIRSAFYKKKWYSTAPYGVCICCLCVFCFENWLSARWHLLSMQQKKLYVLLILFLLGSHCEVDIDECSSSPCVHGTCIDQVNSFKCHCSPGYAGIKCDYNLKECFSNPCYNGGSCVDEVNGFRCDCGPGYRGDHCQIDVDLCKEPMMCVNSLSCIDKGQSVECTCKAGFTGYNCAVNINDCLSHPCKNGGTCRDKVNDFECICPDEFSGKACEGELL